jgi:prefoldin alpha subunit
MIEQKRIESLAAIETMKNLAGDRDSPVLLPIGGGTMVRAKVSDPEKILVNIGSDVVIQRTNGEAITFLQEKITEMEAMEKKVAATIDQLRGQMAEIAQRIETTYVQQQRSQG